MDCKLFSSSQRQSACGRRCSLAVTLLFSALGVFGFSAEGTAASPKRGWAGSDIGNINASNSSWHYNWWHTPPTGDGNSNGEWIPLIKYPNSITNKLSTIQSYAGGVDTLLVLNEPEREDQSNTTVAEALSIWPEIQQTLPNVKLISPAVSDNAEGQAWLSSFMNQVNTRNNNTNASDDIRVDAISFHWYGGSNPTNPVATAISFLSRVDYYHNTYNRPVWITEFAMHDWAGNYTDAEMITANAIFLQTVIPALESRSYVQGYAFYEHFSDSPLLGGSPVTPTAIGDVYANSQMPGDLLELNGVSLGTDVTYLRGGAIANNGAALNNAMRAIDAIESSSSIGGSANWQVGGGGGGGSFVRVRAGATLTKTGASTVTLNALNLDNSGTLRVGAGTLRLASTVLDGPGTTIVDPGATLDVTSAASAPAATFSNQPVRLAGNLVGSPTFSGGSVLTVTSSSAVATGNLTFTNATLNVGGDGFQELSAAVQPIRTGLQLEFDAARDTPGDNQWTNTAGVDSLLFAASASPIAVTSAALPGLSVAYSIPASGGATGLNNYFETNGPRSAQDATFEVAFRVANNSTASNQVLMEVGGADRGAALILNGNSLLFNVDGNGSDLNLSKSLSPGWHHAVGVIDLNASGDTVSLYVNGTLAGTLTGQTIGDWSGGNISGLGTAAGTVTGTTATAVPYHADIALSRYYANTAFGLASVQQNYSALATAPVPQATIFEINGELRLSTGSRLKLDLGENNTSDRLDVSQVLALSGATLEVSYAGTAPLAGGQSFNLIDAASISGSFSALSLPTLAAGLMWRADQLLLDGTLSVALAGDFNSDGAVDGADFTVWRDAVSPTTMAWTSGDANGDRLVNAADYAVWAANFGRQLGPGGVASSAAVPEPSALLAALAAAGLLVALRAKPQ